MRSELRAVVDYLISFVGVGLQNQVDGVAGRDSLNGLGPARLRTLLAVIASRLPVGDRGTL